MGVIADALTDAAFNGRTGPARRARVRTSPERHDGLRHRPLVVHLTTTDMSLDWLLSPQLQAFQEAGYDVVGMSSPGRFVDHLDELGIRHVPVPAFTRSSNPVADLRAFLQLVRRLRELRPDVLHTHNPKPGILGRIAGRITNVPLVVNTQHGLWAQPSDRIRRRWPVYAAERIAAAFGDVELVQNPEDLDTLVDRLRVPAHKVRLLGNGVDLARFDPDAVDDDARRRCRAEWGVSDDEVVCLVVGRLVREKGIVELMETAQEIRRRGLPVRFVFVGPGDEQKSDGIDLAGLDVDHRHGVVFAGERSDMPDCYAAADIFVTASWREGYPRAAMEAAAMRLPTVASNVRGNRQVVDDGVTGLLVRPRSADAFVQAIERLAADPRRRSSMGAAARRRAAEHLDHSRVIERTLRTYERLPNAPRRVTTPGLTGVRWEPPHAPRPHTGVGTRPAAQRGPAPDAAVGSHPVAVLEDEVEDVPVNVAGVGTAASRRT